MPMKDRQAARRGQRQQQNRNMAQSGGPGAPMPMQAPAPMPSAPGMLTGTLGPMAQGGAGGVMPPPPMPQVRTMPGFNPLPMPQGNVPTGKPSLPQRGPGMPMPGEEMDFNTGGGLMPLSPEVAAPAPMPRRPMGGIMKRGLGGLGMY